MQVTHWHALEVHKACNILSRAIEAFIQTRLDEKDAMKARKLEKDVTTVFEDEKYWCCSLYRHDDRDANDLSF